MMMESLIVMKKRIMGHSAMHRSFLWFICFAGAIIIYEFGPAKLGIV